MAEGVEVVVISNDTTLAEGETALLACVGYSQADVEISWSFNGEIVQNSSLVTVFKEEVVRGGRVFTQSYLQLCSLAPSNAGSYVCIVSNGQRSANASTELSVNS